PQRNDGSFWVGGLPDKADVVQFHRKPREIAFGPDLQIMNWDLEFLDRVKFLPHFTLKLRPSHIFTATDGIAGDIWIMGHQAGKSRQIFFGIGSNEGADRRFWADRVSGAAFNCLCNAHKQDEGARESEFHNSDHEQAPCDVLAVKHA